MCELRPYGENCQLRYVVCCVAMRTRGRKRLREHLRPLRLAWRVESLTAHARRSRPPLTPAAQARRSRPPLTPAAHARRSRPSLTPVAHVRGAPAAESTTTGTAHQQGKTGGWNACGMHVYALE